jgi:hypothetical protein
MKSDKYVQECYDDFSREIIEKQFFLHMVIHVFMCFMNICCRCMIGFICSRKINFFIFV